MFKKKKKTVPSNNKINVRVADFSKRVTALKGDFVLRPDLGEDWSGPQQIRIR